MATDPRDLSGVMRAINRLANKPTTSTKDMTVEERRDGIQQMLLDLNQLATKDGCIAAAWALEKLLDWPKEDGDGD